MFLGSSNNPEVIWTPEMRHLLVNAMSQHVGEWFVRLKEVNNAMYEYVPAPHVRYEELEDELFVPPFYLKNFCHPKFDDWSVANPLLFLRAILEVWRNGDKESEEAAAVSPSVNAPQDSVGIVSREQALDILCIDVDSLETQGDKSVLLEAAKIAYKKLALKYHPDRNSGKRELFERVKAAYDYICNGAEKKLPISKDLTKMHLLLQAQAILYQRFCAKLSSHKYVFRQQCFL
jgi:hypothetical protein